MGNPTRSITGMETPLITFRCPPSLLEQFEKAIKLKGMSRSDAIRLAIMQWTHKVEQGG